MKNFSSMRILVFFLSLFALCSIWAPGAFAGGGGLLFSGGFESGDILSEWSEYEDSSRLHCDCYFSGDCVAGMFCSYGSLTVEDNCFFRLHKPSGVPFAGCQGAHFGAWTLGICDGVCLPTSAGSAFGLEDRQTLADGVRLWAQALLGPAAVGGGPVDPELAAQARSLPLAEESLPDLLGRETANLLFLTSAVGFYDHFCHFEGGDHSPDYFVDLSEDSCRLRAGELAAEALAVAVEGRGDLEKGLEGIRDACPAWRTMFAPRCVGESAIECLAQQIAGTAEMLTTAPRLQLPPLASYER